MKITPYDLDIDGVSVRLMGDPHQGRTYTHGVPLHRRGEREEISRTAFRESLDVPETCQLHICVGDIFDKFVVSPSVVLFVAFAYSEFARGRPGTTFVILRGNHDASRDADLRSSFDVLAHLLAGVPNIVVVKDEPEVVQVEGKDFGFIPWHPFRDAWDQGRRLFDACPAYLEAVVGHWDVDSYGGDDHNLIPTGLLGEKTGLAITGHDHKRREFERDGVQVLVTGSLIPQAHGEEIDADLFVTVTLDEFDPETMRDKCVRFVLKPGEDLPEDLDVMAVVRKRVDEQEEEIDLDKVEMSGFDLKSLWDEAAAENGVGLPQSQRVWGFLSERLDTQG